MFVKVCPNYGQILTIEFGPTYFAHKAKSNLHPDVKGDRIANDFYFYKFQYEHIVNNKLNVIINYSKYPVYTFFFFYKKEKNEGGS